MKIVDAFVALICGEGIGLIAVDFLTDAGFHVGFYSMLAIWIVFPLLGLLGLWLASLIGKKYLIVFQVAKHILIGTGATIIDLKLFEGLAWLFSFTGFVNSYLIKGISFLIATTLKYLGNKYWTFQQYRQHDLHKEIIKLLIVDVVGLTINVGAFYFFVKIIGPQFSVSAAGWTKLSVIFAALTSAVTNFLGYKFFVFKK